ncbi:MAG TPA: heat-inducible transcriptional repressor HrcA [Kofleriaceae bacterium]|jgi:heat-inducible transcriptional repressor|nr:heat-inducible transcriptional repressor HrcA [Kofleriaceae bacterium]
MSDNPDLTRRARKILQAVVSEYLQTGDAVGSRTVTRKHSIELSPATVRNVMADLEEMGLLAQPHTSAGRVPTRAGLRFFIDALLKVRSLSTKEKEEIRARTGVETFDLGEVVQRTSRMLAELTPHAGVVLAPSPSALRLQHMEFVLLRGGRALCIMVTTEGQLENKVIQLEAPPDASRLERINNYLRDELAGRSLAEVRDLVLRGLGDQKNQYDELVATALRMSKAALDQTIDRPGDIIVSGQANLIVPDGTPATSRDLLQALEDKEVLLKLLDQSMEAESLQVFLGAEGAHAALEGSSVIATPYGPSDHPIGAIAVIGPMRMNYGKVMSIVDFTAELVSKITTG